MWTPALTILVSGLASFAPQDLPPDPELSVRQNESRRTLSVTYGPLNLPAALDYTGELVTITVETTLPVDGWLRSFEIEVRDADGRRIHEPILHHAGLFAPDRRDLFSPTMERIVAFGQETAPIRLPGQLGYRITPQDRVLLLGALYNPGSQSYEGIEVHLRMLYADARRDARMTDVVALYLDVMPPGNRVYELPPGRSTRSHEWSPAVDGRVIALGGHLHGYGRSLTLENVTTGDTIWTGYAEYEDGELVGVSRRIFNRGVELRADQRYRVSAEYENPHDQPLPGAMGKIGGVFIPAGGQEIPPVDPTTETYLRDWRAMVHHEHEHVHVQATEERRPPPGDPGRR